MSVITASADPELVRVTTTGALAVCGMVLGKLIDVGLALIAGQIPLPVKLTERVPDGSLLVIIAVAELAASFLGE
jgi:hypothetical protein